MAKIKKKIDEDVVFGEKHSVLIMTVIRGDSGKWKHFYK